jgi:hypothetical protein
MKSARTLHADPFSTPGDFGFAETTCAEAAIQNFIESFF